MDIDLDALERSAYAESLPLFHERATPAAVLELIRSLRAANSRLHEVSTHCANVESERDTLRADVYREIEHSRAVQSAADALRAELKAMKQQKPIAWRAVGGSIWGNKTSPDDVPLFEAAGAQPAPSDDTALRAALVKAQEEMRERAAAVCEEVMTGGIAAYAAAIRELEVKP